MKSIPLYELLGVSMSRGDAAAPSSAMSVQIAQKTAAALTQADYEKKSLAKSFIKKDTQDADATLTLDELKKLYDAGLREVAGINDSSPLVIMPGVNAIPIFPEMKLTHVKIEINSAALVDYPIPSNLDFQMTFSQQDGDKVAVEIKKGNFVKSKDNDLYEVLERTYLSTEPTAHKTISSVDLQFFLFDENQKQKYQYEEVKKFHLSDIFNLSHITKTTIQEQLEFIQTLINFEFKDCDFPEGIVLPGFILNQLPSKAEIESPFKPKSPTEFIEILRTAKASLESVKAIIGDGNSPLTITGEQLKQIASGETKTPIILR